MTEGLILGPGAGRIYQRIGYTMKVGAGQSTAWSAFEAEISPGFDVGAHLHHHAEELFYILDGELDLLAFEPRTRIGQDWRNWESASGLQVVRARSGATMFVPAGCPHAFANPGPKPARILILVSPPGFEHYLEDMEQRVAAGPADPATIADIRARHDIEQLTPRITRPASPRPRRASGCRS